jgi:hypothetical protein
VIYNGQGELPAGQGIIFAYPSFDPQVTVNVSSLFKSSSATFNNFQKRDMFSFSNQGMITLSQPFFSIKKAYVGAIGFMYSSDAILNEIISSNVESNDFIYDQLVIFDVKQMTADLNNLTEMGSGEPQVIY